ncbi:hypothetical protein [Actinoplanes aureus]|uniref:NfeD-like C-terminal domain-containing protein n=1 Tax=Actinoplanes aureus TaxID=2792083 RepID=A0A931C8B4_9ACTN|nr:hypothetical protein [Actinoplanes aureus]MBG0564049.1 hypothetical protein [Actinoplanes aureus]
MIKSANFWLALSTGTVGAVTAAAELSGADNPSVLTVALWCVTGAGLLTLALLNYVRMRSSPPERAAVSGFVRAGRVHGEVTGAQVADVPAAGVSGVAVVEHVAENGRVVGLRIGDGRSAGE